MALQRWRGQRGGPPRRGLECRRHGCWPSHQGRPTHQRPLPAPSAPAQFPPAAPAHLVHVAVGGGHGVVALAHLVGQPVHLGKGRGRGRGSKRGALKQEQGRSSRALQRPGAPARTQRAARRLRRPRKPQGGASFGGRWGKRAGWAMAGARKAQTTQPQGHQPRRRTLRRVLAKMTDWVMASVSYRSHSVSSFQSSRSCCRGGAAGCRGCRWGAVSTLLAQGWRPGREVLWTLRAAARGLLWGHATTPRTTLT